MRRPGGNWVFYGSRHSNLVLKQFPRYNRGKLATYKWSTYEKNLESKKKCIYKCNKKAKSHCQKNPALKSYIYESGGCNKYLLWLE